MARQEEGIVEGGIGGLVVLTDFTEFDTFLLRILRLAIRTGLRIMRAGCGKFFMDVFRALLISERSPQRPSMAGKVFPLGLRLSLPLR
jgi:hypothetical protein